MNPAEDVVVDLVDRRMMPLRAARTRAHSISISVPAEVLELHGLAIPPSVNELFANVPGRGRVKSERYKGWKNAVGWDVKAQLKGRRVSGPVHLSYRFGEQSTRADLGNLEKAATDMLVDLQVIDGDDKKVVRRISLEWCDAPGFSVRIEPVVMPVKARAAWGNQTTKFDEVAS